jgi:hypothetical protein
MKTYENGNYREATRDEVAAFDRLNNEMASNASAVRFGHDRCSHFGLVNMLEIGPGVKVMTDAHAEYSQEFARRHAED